MIPIAVILPARDEEAAIGVTVAAFRAALPEAAVFVYDNASRDDTAARAREAGALVRFEARRGKGNVVRRAFADIEAEIYLLADGDATYDAAAAPALVAALRAGPLDMVVGARVASGSGVWRAGHALGNALLSKALAVLFGTGFDDLLSGYRVFSRRFVKSFPLLSAGFEIETEMAVHALALRMPVAEMPVGYFPRPAGSASKLATWSDGLRILRSMAMLLRQERPLPFFGALAALLATAAIVLALPLASTYARTGLVPRLPTAVLCTGLMLLGSLLLTAGLVLDSVARGRLEMRRLAYLGQRPVRAD